MNSSTTVTPLESSPSVPGGGPASRWRASRITSGFAWTWCALLVACLVASATVVVTMTAHHGITVGGITTLVVVGCVLLVLLCGVYAAWMAAVEGRVDDDMRVHGVGRRVSLALRRGSASWSRTAPLEVADRTVGRVERGFTAGGLRTTVVLGAQHWRWSVGPDRLELAAVFGEEDGPLVAVAHRHGPRCDWEIEVDGRLLRVRHHVGRPLPRRTLIDDLGRAWLVRRHRRGLEGRLPAELSDLGVAFCLLAVAELDESVAPGPGPGGGGGGVDDVWVDDSWTGDSWNDPGGGSDTSGGSDGGGSWFDGGSSWSDGGSSGSDSSWW